MYRYKTVGYFVSKNMEGKYVVKAAVGKYFLCFLIDCYSEELDIRYQTKRENKTSLTLNQKPVSKSKAKYIAFLLGTATI